jgi:hypothetical protein
MQNSFLKVLTIALLLSLAAYGQSLADVARETRDKQKADEASGTQPKVITNSDLLANPSANPQAHPVKPARNNAADKAADRRAAEQRRTDQRTAEQWKKQIVTQENKIANLQKQIDQIKSSIQYRGGTAQYEGPYNVYESRQLQRVAQMQQELDQQNRRLADLQEAARHAGMHTLVYDP